MKLADSHCHLDDKQFNEDREQVIERAGAAGVGYMLAIGTGDGPPDLEPAVRIAEKHASIYATVGVHPNDALKIDEHTFGHLESLCRHPKVRAIGEIGLDLHWGIPEEAQTAIFIRQLEIAREAKMPIVIHTRDAWKGTMAILRAHWAPTGLPCVMHCFTGDAEQARACLDLDFYLAFGGATTFPKSTSIREAAMATRIDRLLIETDAPYLAPVPHRGRRNEPAFVADTARVLAELHGIPLEELARETTRNFERIFLPVENKADSLARPLH